MIKEPITTKFSTEDHNIFFTSDTHFGHANIIKYCSRPWSNVDDMNDALISNWNSVVSKNDIVFHLGDFGFNNITELANVCDKLNGKIYLITGNHDRKILRNTIASKFECIMPELYINIDGQKIYLNHKPYLCFDGSFGRADHTWTWQLFGHVHSGPLNKTGLDMQRLNVLFPTQYDVGVDNNEYKPISFSEVKEIITHQQLSQNIWRK